MIWLALAVTGLFAAVHLFAGRLRFIRTTPRSRWLSLFGGVSVAYVFVHLLPEAEHFGQQLSATVMVVDRPVYLLALLGVIVFYGLERWVIRSRGDDATMGRGQRDVERDAEPPGESPFADDPGDAHDAEGAPPGVFWIHLASFGLYNVLICYLLVLEAQYQPTELILYATAMSLHFVVNDFGLREHHTRLYHRYGRFLLASAALVGWAIGAFAPTVPTAVTASLFGFLCGATVLNVLKEELPAERESRFWAFGLGAAGFAALLLALPTTGGGHGGGDDGGGGEGGGGLHEPAPSPHSPA